MSRIEGMLARVLLARDRPAPLVEPPAVSRRISRECMADAHDMCPGWAGAIWAEDAAYASDPLVVVVCGCPTPECDCVAERRRLEAER